jgi:hypothetical protein
MTTTYTGQQRFLPTTPAPGVQHWHIPIGPLALWQYFAGPPEHLIPIPVMVNAADPDRERWLEQRRQDDARTAKQNEAEPRAAAREEARRERERREAEQLHRAEDARALADAPATAWRLVDHGTAEITRADAKAGFAGTVELAALFAVVDGKAGIHGPLQWIAGGLLVAAVIVTVLAVWPSLPSRRTGASWLHFGALRQLPAGELADRIQTGHLEGICRQATEVARIAYSKHARLRWSLLIALAGVVAAVLATI